MITVIRKEHVIVGHPDYKTGNWKPNKKKKTATGSIRNDQGDDSKNDRSERH